MDWPVRPNGVGWRAAVPADWVKNARALPIGAGRIAVVPEPRTPPVSTQVRRSGRFRPRPTVIFPAEMIYDDRHHAP